MQGRLFARRDEDRKIAHDVGNEDFDKVYTEQDMASGSGNFCCNWSDLRAYVKWYSQFTRRCNKPIPCRSFINRYVPGYRGKS